MMAKGTYGWILLATNDLDGTGDTTHEQALNEMKGRRMHPIKGMGWYKNTKREFAEMPAD